MLGAVLTSVNQSSIKQLEGQVPWQRSLGPLAKPRTNFLLLWPMLIRNTQFREIPQLCVVRGGEGGGGGEGPRLLLFILVPVSFNPFGTLDCAIIKAPSGLLRAATWNTYLIWRLWAPGPGTLAPSFPSVSQVPSVCACPLLLATHRFFCRQWKDGLYVIYQDLRFFEMHVCACSFYTTTYKPFTENFQFRVTLIIFSIDFVLLERKKADTGFFWLWGREWTWVPWIISSTAVIGRE